MNLIRGNHRSQATRCNTSSRHLIVCAPRFIGNRVDSTQKVLHFASHPRRSRETIRRTLTTGGLDQPSTIGWNGEMASLRRLLFDLVEEYGRHTGHADLLREAIDGTSGEDPPSGMPWPPL